MAAMQQVQMAAMQNQLQQQQQQQQAAIKKAEEFRAMTLAFEKTAEATPDDLPALTVPNGTQKNQHAQLYQLLATWSHAGASTPFSFQDMITHTTMGADAPLFVRAALGSKWSLWFVPDPIPTQIIPRQVSQLLLLSLEKLKAQWQDAVIAQGNEEDAFVALERTAKKRRAELLDQDMEDASNAAEAGI